MSVDENLSDIEHVRKRPGMYVGSTGFFGVIHYLVDATNLILQHSPSKLAFSIDGLEFSIGSDVVLPVFENENGGRFPFECFRRDGNSVFSHGPVLTALSDRLSYSERSTGGVTIEYAYRNGARTVPCGVKWPDEFRSHLSFAPDATLFDEVPISNYNLASYLRRISYLHPGTEFSLDDNGRKSTFRAENGIRDMFVGFASPYQLVHEPIVLQRTDGPFSMEFVFALHSWKNDVCCSFVNKGRAVEGGTHQDGLERAVTQMRDEVFATSNGVVGLLSIHYPKVQWHGCIKATVRNPELTGLVCDSIVNETMAYLDRNPVVFDQIKHAQTFQFPDAWLS
ncbi:MAG: hypothetical protein AAFX06_14500 [Planctomycetota bacterium]